MLNAGALTFREFTVREPLPLATIHEAVLEFLEDRSDAVLFGAQAVNAYVNEPRMTQDVDILSTRARALADEAKEFLSKRFHIAVRVREIGDGRGYRLYHVRKEGNRHLVDFRPVEELPPFRRVDKVPVMELVELIASKVISYCNRIGSPKSFTDRRDLAILLLEFPDLKSPSGPVADALRAMGAEQSVVDAWKDLAEQPIKLIGDDDEFDT